MDGTAKKTRRYAPVRKSPALAPANRRFSRGLNAIRPNEYLGRITFTSTDLAPLPPSGQADFLLLDAVKDSPITVTAPLPANVDYTDTVQLMLNGVLVDAAVTVDAFIDAGDDTMRLTLSAAARKTATGKVFINYICKFVSGDGSTEKGPEDQFYTTDFTVPGVPFLGELDFPDEVDESGITPAAMQTDGDGNEYLEALVPSFGGNGPGDKIHGLIGTTEEAIDAAEDGNGGYHVSFLRSFIEANEDADGDGEPDGKLSFSYVVIKRSGIRSDKAKPVVLDVLLTDAFVPPTARIPAYDDDEDPKLVDEADARADGGLIVEIGGNAGFKAQDQIFVDWGGAEVGPTTVVDPAANPVATIGIPYQTISDIWGAATAGADKAEPVAVTYRVMRGVVEAGKPAAAATVSVNLHQAGGVDPDPETPENENLVKPTLTSSSGKPNEIPPTDFEKDAKVTIPFELIKPPGTPTFVIDDSVIGTYDNEPFQTFLITAVPTAPFDLTLPGALIKKHGSGTKSLYYSVLRSLADGGANMSSSPIQEVTVHGTDELPGGGDPLKAGTVPEAVGGDELDPVRVYVGKDEAKDGTDFIIAPYKNQSTEDTIVLEMKVFRSFYGTAGHPADKPPANDRNVRIEGIHPTGTASPTTVHLTEVQLMRYDLPTQSLHAHVTYTVTGATTSDRPQTSEILLMDIDPRGD
jgi:hypothetical protein